MVRLIGKLSSLRCRTAGIGMHADGGGLYLHVRKGAEREGKNVLTRSWVYRYAVDGREAWMGLGSYPDISLAVAREKAADARRLRADGIDPLAAKRDARAALSRQQAEEKARAMTFAECATAYIDSHQASWRGAKYAQQWVTSLATYANPILGPLPVSHIDTGLVMQVLSPIWQRIPETAAQVRGRLELILDWARVHGYRSGENPARWRGHLDHLLPSRFKVRPVKHHPALPYHELPAFMVTLQQREAVAARCLEFLILTACRTNEAQRARWYEMDFATRTWTIPAARTKANREHRVPLSSAAIAVLAQMQQGASNLVFEGAQSPMALRGLLARMGRIDITPHGFRATFRSWCAECTNFPAEIAEMALGHAISSKVEAAYQRGDMLDRRRRLMQAWADHCHRQPASAEIVSLRSA